MSYLVDRTEVYWIGKPTTRPRSTFSSMSPGSPGAAPTAAPQRPQQRFPGTSYITVFADARYQVAQKR